MWKGTRPLSAEGSAPCPHRAGLKSIDFTLFLSAFCGENCFPGTNNLVSIQGLSFVTYYGEANLNYERIIDGSYGVSGTLAGYSWPGRNSILDRNDHRVEGFGFKLGGKKYLERDKYFELFSSHQRFKSGTRQTNSYLNSTG